jgi:peroxiredoxin
MLKNKISMLLIYMFFGISVQSIHAAVIGSKVSDFRLSDASGKNHSLNAYSGKIVVLVFWSYKCATSSRYSNQIESIQNKYDRNRVVVLGISAGPDETAENILKNKMNLGVTFPVLLDTEGRVAASLDATHSPSVFIIDGTGRLRYQGALDNNKKMGEEGRRAYAEDAIDAILTGRNVEISEIEAFGCSMRARSF